MKSKENVRKQGIQPINDTWAIRGIEPETRTAAQMAARRAGETVGKWCNRVIRDAATERLKERVAGPTIEDTLTKLAESMARQAEATSRQIEAAQQQNAVIAARLEAVEQRGQGPGRNGGGNLLGRLYGLLRRPVAQPDARSGRD